ncbi:MAG: Imm40 family immunity protein [Clostridia bacterium]|nr:Imm40 family immunity protein [Clostridia bacterium]
MNLLNNVIPKEMFKEGVDLSKIGINEYAWGRQKIESIVKILSTQKIVILGGDVYKVRNNNIETTYDSWYIDNDGSKDIYLKSYVVTLNYIDKYEKNNFGNFLYTITI